MLDSYNILGLKVVPITLLIDEAGIIRYRNPSGNDLDAPIAHREQQQDPVVDTRLADAPAVEYTLAVGRVVFALGAVDDEHTDLRGGFTLQVDARRFDGRLAAGRDLRWSLARPRARSSDLRVRWAAMRSLTGISNRPSGLAL